MLTGGGNDYLAAFDDKHAQLQDRSSPRLIFVGGSNVAFGFDSSLVPRMLPLKPVNTGLHANLGLRFMLDVVRDELRFGDVVVVSPEYELFQIEYSPVVQMNLVKHCPQAFRYVIASPCAFLDRDAAVYARELTRQGVRGLLRLGRQRVQEGPYCRGGFNEHGDLVAHFGLPKKDISRSRLFLEKFVPHRLQASIALLNQFHDDCLARGATVYLSFPPLPKQHFDASRNAVCQIEAALRRELAFPILDDAEQMTFPEHEFFDTMYHLDAAGREKRTLALLNNLSQYVRCHGIDEAARPVERR
jgi:hypothetical protein